MPFTQEVTTTPWYDTRLEISKGDVKFASSQCCSSPNNMENFKKFLLVNNNSGTVGDNTNFLLYMLIQ